MKKNIFENMILLGIIGILLYIQPCLAIETNAQPIPSDAALTKTSGNTEPKLNPYEKPAPFVYSSKNKKDPFVPILLLMKLIEENRTKERKFIAQKGKPTPFEDDELKDIKIGAVIQLGKEYIATGILPNGKAFSIHIGDRLGKHGGSVSYINLKCVKVKEEYLDEKGKKITTEKSMPLKKEDNCEENHQ